MAARFLRFIEREWMIGPRGCFWNCAVLLQSPLFCLAASNKLHASKENS
jgi:hypothetical protein